MDAAIADFNEAIKLEPKNVWNYQSRGMMKQKKGDIDGAIADFKKAIEINPNDASAAISHEQLGDLYMERGKINLARSEWNKALGLSTEAESLARLKAKLNGSE